MNAVKQHTEPQKVEPSQSKQERSHFSFKDNRVQTANQANLIQSIHKKENKTGLPDDLKLGIENLSGFSMDDVRVHYNSSKPAQLSVLAYTQGLDIYIGPGQEKYLPHEAWHVVQQRQGRVSPTMKLQNVNMSINEDLETEADFMGDKSMKCPIKKSDSFINNSFSKVNVLQPRLGFELELLVLVDVNGRPASEKINLGKIGSYISITADQNSIVEAQTPTSPERVGVYESPGYNDENMELGDYDMPTPWVRHWCFMQYDNIKQSYNTENEARVDHPVLGDGEKIIPLYYNNVTNEETIRHPRGPGMGNNTYASIIELVTDAFSPENDDEASVLLSTMQEAVNFANSIDPNVRTPLKDIGNVTARQDNINIGHNNSINQSVNASIQTTVGVDLAHYASMIKSTIGFLTQSLFITKHDSDTTDPSGSIHSHTSNVELPASVTDATDIINSIGHFSGHWWWKKESSLVNTRGLISLICQYLRMGKYSCNMGPSGDRYWALDKNFTTILSRTDLCILYQSLPEDEKVWIQKHKKKIRRAIYTHTNRKKHSTVFTDIRETISYPDQIDVQTFINNVLGGASIDGITNNLGGFRQMDMEDIDPVGNKDHKTGGVFEIRNMAPADEITNDRFPPDSWLNLAQYFITLLKEINSRTDANARYDTKIKTDTEGRHTQTINEQTPW